MGIETEVKMTYGPYKAKVVYIHDGDTLGLDIDLGFSQYIISINPITNARQMSCRLYGINAPELSTPDGIVSLTYIKSILPIGAVVDIVSYGWDKYGGRFDGVVTYNDQNINDLMISSGHAVAI